MKAFVTGGTGFIGGHLVDTLVSRGDEVTALVRDPRKAQDIARRGARLAVGDLSHPDLAAHLEGQDVVYHLAGLVAARSEAEFLATNRDGTEALVQAAVRAGASRFVLVSSLAAAGPATTGSPLAGHEPPQPVTRYGRSKLAAERVVIGAPIDWTIVRPPAVYGPGDREMFRIFRAASRGLGPVFGDGSQQLSLVYGPDLAEAIAAIGPAPVAGRIFHAAHPEILTTRRIVELAGAAVGKRVRIIGVPAWIGRGALRITDAAARLANRATVLSADKAHEFFAPAWLADPAPLAEAVGWTAAHDFATGARAAVDWYRRRGWL